MIGLKWSNDSESYADGNVANGMVSYARKVKGGGPDKKVVLQVGGGECA